MAAKKTLQLYNKSQDLLLSYVSGILQKHKSFGEFRSKMEAIDVAYARYQAKSDDITGEVPCNIFESDNVVAPIVVSQVDSMLAYLADVFVSGYPIFPVVSTPKDRMWAEQLETLIDDHAMLGRYARQIILFLKDGVKYNLSALEIDWTTLPQFSVSNDYRITENSKIARTEKSFNAITRLDPYNTIWDYSLAPGDVSADGDYAGYIKILSRVKMKKYLNKLSDAGELYNSEKAMRALESNSQTTDNYYIHPQVSDYVSARKPSSFDWENYIIGSANSNRSRIGGDHELIVLYIRILPSDFGIRAPQENTPQIWRLSVMNGSILIEARRIISAYDNLPILFGQPNEDGLHYQTQSIAEAEIPIQEAATTLYNIRFAAARRAVSDRALYDASAVSEDSVNSPEAAPKIPVRLSVLKNQTLESVYRPIPFDMRGTETTINDAAQLVEFSKQLSGLNNARQGQFQKGNKSVTEWNDVMGSGDSRLRLPAMILECQVFIPLKQIIVLNIFQYGDDAIVVSQKTGETITIKMDELRKKVLSFRISDGVSPKSKMASVEAIGQGLNLLMNSPILQQRYGDSLPAMFAHMMQLAGVRGLEEYSPEIQQQVSVNQQPPTALANQFLQAPVPTAESPIPPTSNISGAVNGTSTS